MRFYLVTKYASVLIPSGLVGYVKDDSLSPITSLKILKAHTSF